MMSTRKVSGIFIIFLVSIFLVGGSNEFQITTDVKDQRSPAIYGDIVVWVDERNGNEDIYGYYLSTQEEFPITTEPHDQSSPAIYQDIVVWADTRNGNTDIYGFNLLTQKEFQITNNPHTQ